METFKLLSTFLVGIFASFVGSMAGSGGLISIPFLVLIGIDPHVAIATHRVGAVGLQVGALARFVRSREIAWRYVLPLSLLALIAAQVGSRLLLQTDESILRKVIIAVMLITLPVVLLNRDMGLKNIETSRGRRAIGYAAIVLVLVWQAYFGGAAASMTFFAMMFFFGMTLNAANATSKIPGLLLGFSTLLIFAANGLVNWVYGIVMFFGMLLGGYLGAHAALKKGNTWVKGLYAVVVLLSAAKMILE